MSDDKKLEPIEGVPVIEPRLGSPDERTAMREAAGVAANKLPGTLGVVLGVLRARQEDGRVTSSVESLYHRSVDPQKKEVEAALVTMMADWLRGMTAPEDQAAPNPVRPEERLRSVRLMPE